MNLCYNMVKGNNLREKHEMVNLAVTKLRDRPLFFLEGEEGGIRDIEKKCLQGLKRQSKLYPLNCLCFWKKMISEAH